jgi:hypothetical protein
MDLGRKRNRQNYLREQWGLGNAGRRFWGSPACTALSDREMEKVKPRTLMEIPSLELRRLRWGQCEISTRSAKQQERRLVDSLRGHSLDPLMELSLKDSTKFTKINQKVSNSAQIL